MKTHALLALALIVATGCAGGDADGDGFASGIDCDDDNNLVFPGALERCDGVDNDCNNVVDDGYAAEAVVFFFDEDGDGYGTTKESTMSCADVVPNGFVADASDCDDDDRDVNPGAEELCNLVDDNCNKAVDDNPVDAIRWFADNDEDGFGSRTLSRLACERPVGNWVDEGGDCNDFDFLVNPNALEYCDGIDNDCDDTTDEPDAEDHKVWYLDSDGDGFGDEQYPIDACYLPEGYSADPTDCNDDPAKNGALQTPGVAEICQDGIDNNCNNSPDQCSYLGWEYGGEGSLLVEGKGGGYLGYSVGRAGDVDGDGIDDIIWGAYYWNEGYQSGAGVLQYGEVDGTHAESELDATEMPRWTTSTSYDYFSRHVNTLGDIDRDGYDDFGIGSYTYDGGASNGGTMAIIYGDSSRYDAENVNIEDEDTPSVVGYESTTYLGTSFSGVGDVTGDGYADVLVGGSQFRYEGNYGAGGVWLVPGSATRYDHEVSVEPFASFHGPTSYTYLGYYGNSIDGGDLDGDGTNDMVMGAYGYASYAGATFVVYGSSAAPTGANLIDEYADASFGGSGSSQYVGGDLSQIPGDIDGDGYDDLVIGHRRANNYAGSIYILFGDSSRFSGDGNAADDADIIINGTGNSTYLGYGRTALGDFDGDFDPTSGEGMEFAAGAYRASVGSGSYNGAVYIFDPGMMGEDGEGITWRDIQELNVGEDETYTVKGPNGTYMYYGWHADSGDFNGDGYDDLISGGYGIGGYTGAGTVFFGNSI